MIVKVVTIFTLSLAFHLRPHFLFSTVSLSIFFYSPISKLTAFSSCIPILSVIDSELYLEQTGERKLFSIEVFHGRNVRAHSIFDTEDEILMLPGTYMEVLSRLDLGPDLHIMHLKQKRPHLVLLEPPLADTNRFSRQLVPL